MKLIITFAALTLFISEMPDKKNVTKGKFAETVHAFEKPAVKNLQDDQDQPG